MDALISVILPVFLVIGFGYLSVKLGFFSAAGVDGLTKFTQNFAIPCLLFRAISTLDLHQSFDAQLLASFYTGATAGFVLGIAGARLLFNRGWEDAVAIGFCCLFSNSVLLGLPITERAFGAAALDGNYGIISIHAPFCYVLGVTTMEVVKSRGTGFTSALLSVGRSMMRNALVIGIALGFLVNLSGAALPMVLTDAVDLMVRAALPAALFALGGILVRYRPEGDMRTILYVCLISLVVHPAITWAMGRGLGLSDAAFRSAIMTAAMAPGINSYLFASIYQRAQRVAASSVLIGTALTMFTAWLWLILLP